jgi:hypothetical protein
VTKEKPVIVYQYDGTGGKCPSVMFKMEHDRLAANNEIVRGEARALECDRDGKITIRPTDPDYEAKIATMDTFIETDRRFGSHYTKIPKPIKVEQPAPAVRAEPSPPAKATKGAVKADPGGKKE